MNINLKPPDFDVPQNFKSRVTRTTNPMRPTWLDDMRRPLRIVAFDEKQFQRFIRLWRFNGNEVRRIRDATDLTGVVPTWPLLVLPDGGKQFADYFDSANPLRHWHERGGSIIDVPQCVLETKGGLGQWPIETNLCGETIVHIAKQKHLDGLNRKR